MRRSYFAGAAGTGNARYCLWIAATTTIGRLGLLVVHNPQSCSMHVVGADAFAVRGASPIRQSVAVRRRIRSSLKNIVGNFCCSSTNKKTMYTIDCPPTDPEKLQRTVTKHVQTLDRFLESRFIANHTAAAFGELEALLPSDGCGGDIILDSGCGTGRSSILLGQQFPECTVIGVDRSLARLSKRPYLFKTENDDKDDDDDTNGSQKLVYQAASNVWLVRAELVDFWRLLLQSNYRVTRHYLLYPNPYPKPKRFKSRWYAHPSFPLLLRIASETTIVRSNWELYLQEFAAATECATEQNGDVCLDLDPIETIQPFSTKALTNFEQKYWDVGELTFQLVLRRSMI